ncbi:capsule biosynthesis protein [Mucilaginibacter pallidiroseus]|uniref:Capsule biosynthesis protein n=1 Tax=Mucilaginibacter pallidiroseus TaxID=2599295 RepID=A0A563UIN2_9SPHI|nr:SLBB domain-containing protein [Mucilaginibacter pallidiroseus]TWR31166.1 capsule biosynthesis protein [Mucilaginibacter pallidiroseus]
MNKLKPLLILLCIALYSICADSVKAQTVPQNLSGVVISDLSDDQLRQAMQQAASSGLSDAQLLQTLKARGLSDSQAQVLQTRIQSLRQSSASQQSKTANTEIINESRTLNYIPDTIVKADEKVIDIFKPRIFGADLFRNNNIKFEPNLKIATPVNYIVGPDDQLNINVFGNSLVNWKLAVSPEGNINIPGAGILNVSGKTIEQVTSLIKNKLAANNYAIGRGTNVNVTLGDIRSIKVIMVGEVSKPGTYTLPSLATAFTALYAAGGPSDIGSFRQIEILRNNRIVRRLDVYDFLTKGDQKDNIALQDQDIIRVPTYRTRVELAGEVKVPAIFEVLPGEKLADIIRFAGGFTDQAYTARIKVSQINEQQRRITDVLENDFKNYVPLRGDRFVVDRILDRYENRVTINGAVFRPGEYELQKGLTVSQLISNAAGLKEDAFSGRGSITRLKPDNTTELLSFDVKAVVAKTAPDILLQREDVVNISSIFDLRDKYRLTIKGEVRNEGEYAYSEGISVEDLILKAGGFTEGASSKRIEVSRRVTDSDPTSRASNLAQVFVVNVDNELKAGEADFKLKPFDIVSVYTLPGYERQITVKVEGEVLYPGYYTVKKKNEKISDIIARAGGITASADVDGGTLKRDNIAILGIDRNKTDTAAIEKERIDRLSRLKQSYKDSTQLAPEQLRNSYVGIDLKSILKKPGTFIDLIMEDNDVIRIPKQQQIVRVNGEVLYPSAVVYNKSKSFNDFVLNAGGYAPTALKKGAYVVYPNGTVKGTSKFLFFNVHPSVKPGSEIYVPKKPVRRSLSAAEVVGLTSGLASLGAIILGIINLSK